MYSLAKQLQEILVLSTSSQELATTDTIPSGLSGQRGQRLAHSRAGIRQIGRLQASIVLILFGLLPLALFATVASARTVTLSCSSASMTGAGTDACTVTTNPASSHAATASLSSSSAAVTLPATVSIPAGATSAAVTATVASVTSAQAVTLTATVHQVSGSFALQLNAAQSTTPTLVVSTSGSPSTYKGAVTFTAKISSGPTGTVTFYNNGVSIGTGQISGTTATLTTSSLTAGSHSVTASWPGNSNYGAVTSAAIVQKVNRATPTIIWPTPAAIAYGTALSKTQLDATSPTPGTFTYTPAAGTVLSVGTHILSVLFTTPDSTGYTAATRTVSIVVTSKVAPTITWATPAAITYGTALSATQLNASSTTAGTFAYTPSAGTILAAGAQTLSVTFTPTDSTDYSAATQTVTLTVNQGTSTLGINATTVAFGSVDLNTPTTQSLTLTSTGSASVTISAATVTGAGFTVSGATFPITLSTGQTATLAVQFDPTVAGAASGKLTITSNSSTGSSSVISLTGTGTATPYQVALTWSAPTSSAVPVTGYDILRSPSGTSAYQLLNSTLDTQTAYVDTTVQSGVSYDYTVESVSASGVESVPSNTFSVTIP